MDRDTLDQRYGRIVFVAIGVLVVVGFAIGVATAGDPGDVGLQSGWALLAVVGLLLGVLAAGVFVHRQVTDEDGSAERSASVGTSESGSAGDSGGVSESGGAGGSTSQALEELRTAYARGDVGEEEFERRRKRLKRDG